MSLHPFALWSWQDQTHQPQQQQLSLEVHQEKISFQELSSSGKNKEMIKIEMHDTMNDFLFHL